MIVGIHELYRRLPGLTPSEITAALERLKTEGLVESVVEEKFRLAKR